MNIERSDAWKARWANHVYLDWGDWQVAVDYVNAAQQPADKAGDMYLAKLRLAIASEDAAETLRAAFDPLLAAWSDAWESMVKRATAWMSAIDKGAK